MADLTHIGADGRPRIVDISHKSDTSRQAIARGRIWMSADALSHAETGKTRKGSPIHIAELAGIMAAKKTADLIPLCHPLPLSHVHVEINTASKTQGPALTVIATVKTSGKTGVEMEALTAVSVACLTLYDMLKSVDKGMRIGAIELLEKTGGKSGDYKKSDLQAGKGSDAL